MTCGGAAVSLAAVGSSGSTSGMPLAAGGEAFAVGYGGGAVTLLDGRCRERGGMVGGFVTSHRWLERVRCAGYLLMTSYGRCGSNRVCVVCVFYCATDYYDSRYREISSNLALCATDEILNKKWLFVAKI